MAADIVDEATAVDAAEDAQPGIDDDVIPPQLQDRASRREMLKKALASIDEEKQVDAGKSGGVDAARKRVEQATAEHAKLIKRTERLETEFADKVAAGIAHPGPKPLPVQQNKTIAKAAHAVACAEHTLAARSVSTEEGGTGKVYKRNLTDPESRLMKAARTGGFVQGLNAQIVVSEDYLIIAADVTDDPTDYGSYQPMIAAALATAQELTGTTNPIGVVVADAGYFGKQNVTAPGPNRLIAPGKARTLEKAVKTGPAQGDPPPDATPVEAMIHRLRTEEGIRTYRRRAAIVEPVNSHLKDRRRLRQFARRGLAAAKAELHLAAAVTNMLRLHTALAGAVI